MEENKELLELLQKIDVVVFDKTGTLTTGHPSVTDIVPNGITEQELISIAAELEHRSEHPFAKAIMRKAEGISVGHSEDFKVIPGMGVSAVINGKQYYGGNRRLMEHVGVAVPLHEEFTQHGKTPLYFAAKDRYLGMIAAADVLKNEAVTVVHMLKNLGLRTVMLTGDHQQTAQESRRTHRDP